MKNRKFKRIDAALHGEGELPTWSQLQAEFSALLAAELTDDDVVKLREILRFDGRLQLASQTDLPHRMSPEDILKLKAKHLIGLIDGSEATEAES